MSQPPPHRYLAGGKANGASETVLRTALARIAETDAHDAEPILSLGHLAHLSGAPYLYLRQIAQRTIDPYVDITRAKKAGGARPISAPEPVLMDVQRIILQRALEGLPQHPASFAYRKRRSIVMCAQRHVGARWLLKFDLHDFFGRISERRVYEVFRSRGYSSLVSLELARLCTRSFLASGWRRHGRRYTAVPSYDVDRIGYLPQGGPTSGALANAVATPLDESLHRLSSQAGFTYTRYSDDLVLSSAEPFNRAVAGSVIGAVRKTVADHNFRLHAKKTRVVPPGTRHIILGLLVSDDDVRLTPEFRRKIQVHVRGVNKFGLMAHADYRSFRSVLAFISHVEGCLAFAASVEPDWADRTRNEWHSVLRNQHYPI
ncbi:reverse transcriptase family protein [Geodermatophilus sp. SYSU D00691]